MSKEELDGNPQDQVTPPTDQSTDQGNLPNDLDGIDPTLLENEDRIQMIDIDGKEVAYDNVVQAYKDMQNNDNWKSANDTRAKEIAAEKRALEEERAQFDRQRQEFETMARGMYDQQQTYQQPQYEQPNTGNLQLSQEDLEDMTPVEKALYLEMQENRRYREEQQKQYEADRFNADMQTRHQKMKSVYDDYDPRQIESQIIQGYDPFEAVHLSNKYKALSSGDKESIMKFIPPATMDEIKKEVRAQLIEDVRKRETERQKVATIVDNGKGLSRQVPKEPKNWHEVNQNVVEKMKQEGISLIK